MYTYICIENDNIYNAHLDDSSSDLLIKLLLLITHKITLILS